MLRKIRITLSIVLFSLITFYFLDFAELLPPGFSLLADIQFVPALLALNVVVLVALVAATLLLGRVYCSAICPMGIFQDIVAWFSKKLKRRKRYTHSKAKGLLRWSILGATVIAFLCGFTFLLGLLDPYGAYGRFVTHLFRPLYLAGNNLLETIFISFNNYSLYRVGIYSLGLFSLLLALGTLLGIGMLAWLNGRTYCNTVCPVGTLLGFLSRFSLLKIQFVEEKCNGCGLCSMKCKASCIDTENRKIDYSRCVNCFNCIDICKHNGIRYAPVGLGDRSTQREEVKQPDGSKRRFLSALLLTGVAAGKVMAQNGAASLLTRRELKRQTPIAPPGAISFDHFRAKCISCHLCVSKCPSHVIKPAFLEYGPGGMMQPKLYFDHGFCNYDCTVCCDICPTDALVKLSREEKHHTQMGQVNFIRENCIVYYDETSCGACSEHCPTQAVYMVPYKGSLTIPETNPDICVGCGGCEYVCPAIPHKAIYVEGLPAHNTIEIKEVKAEEVIVDEFGF